MKLIILITFKMLQLIIVIFASFATSYIICWLLQSLFTMTLNRLDKEWFTSTILSGLVLTIIFIRIIVNNTNTIKINNKHYIEF